MHSAADTAFGVGQSGHKMQPHRPSRTIQSVTGWQERHHGDADESLIRRTTPPGCAKGFAGADDGIRTRDPNLGKRSCASLKTSHLPAHSHVDAAQSAVAHELRVTAICLQDPRRVVRRWYVIATCTTRLSPRSARTQWSSAKWPIGGAGRSTSPPVVRTQRSDSALIPSAVPTFPRRWARAAAPVPGWMGAQYRRRSRIPCR